MARLATPEGTRRYAARFPDLAPGFFRRAGELTVSSVGLGTYLGDPDDATDALYLAAIKDAVRGGVNLIDAAINYRCMRSERVIGRALAELAAEGFGRDELVVCTKGGYVPFDTSWPKDPDAYFRATYRDTGLVRDGELAAGCHCMAPTYLKDQLARSRKNLGTDIDIYYLHNPETQLDEIPRDEFDRRLKAAFAVLEEARAAGALRYFGAATWNGFRVPPEATEHLGLARFAELAAELGAKGFGVIQLPYNLVHTEAYATRTQPLGGARTNALAAAEALGLAVMVSVPTMQSRLARGLPGDVRDALGLDTDAQRAIQFVRSTPGVTAALVGMKRAEHVRENLGVAKSAAAPEVIEGLFARRRHK